MLWISASCVAYHHTELLVKMWSQELPVQAGLEPLKPPNRSASQVARISLELPETSYFNIFTMMCLGVDIFEFNLPGVYGVSWMC
jgi:hypothetical protein